ncbi:hypothetical protein AMR76_11295 [Vibrio furnissii]|uniref:Uncharacterized protein n=1 Tax=Vibrio furnissii TaxID=29494 RepID=A0A0Q2MDS6_VIBFU|nr:hypothetical protein AMR76_11295 [Vibrio furnissii]
MNTSKKVDGFDLCFCLASSNDAMIDNKMQARHIARSAATFVTSTICAAPYALQHGSATTGGEKEC